MAHFGCWDQPIAEYKNPFEEADEDCEDDAEGDHPGDVTNAAAAPARAADACATAGDREFASADYDHDVGASVASESVPGS